MLLQCRKASSTQLPFQNKSLYDLEMRRTGVPKPLASTDQLGALSHHLFRLSRQPVATR